MTKNYWDEVFESNPSYLHNELEGKDHPSRAWSADILQRHQSVLDVGCGTGVELESLRAKGLSISYTGTDYSLEACRAATAMYPTESFSQDDARGLHTFADGSYDVVMLRHTLEHVNEWQKALASAWRVAKKAVLVILWVTPDAGATKVDDKGGDAFYVHFAESDLIDLFAALGARSWKKTVILDGVKDRPHRVDTCYEVTK